MLWQEGRRRIRRRTPGLCLVILLTTQVAPAQMQLRMEKVPRRATKIDIRPLQQGQQVGSRVPVAITLLDGSNQVAAMPKPVQLEIEVTSPSGKSRREFVSLAPGESDKNVVLDVQEVGVARLRVRDRGNELLEGTSSFLVRPMQAKRSVSTRRR